MNYETIAEMVHDFVKNPKSTALLAQKLLSKGVTTEELKVLENVFSKYEVSGDVLTVGLIPEDLWG